MLLITAWGIMTSVCISFPCLPDSDIHKCVFVWAGVRRWHTFAAVIARSVTRTLAFCFIFPSHYQVGVPLFVCEIGLECQNGVEVTCCNTFFFLISLPCLWCWELFFMRVCLFVLCVLCGLKAWFIHVPPPFSCPAHCAAVSSLAGPEWVPLWTLCVWCAFVCLFWFAYVN